MDENKTKIIDCEDCKWWSQMCAESADRWLVIDDLVTRLRNLSNTDCHFTAIDLGDEAADEIERLAKRARQHNAQVEALISRLQWSNEVQVYVLKGVYYLNLQKLLDEAAEKAGGE